MDESIVAIRSWPLYALFGVLAVKSSRNVTFTYENTRLYSYTYLNIIRYVSFLQ